MKESNSGDDQPRLAARQAQQPQPAARDEIGGWSEQATPNASAENNESLTAETPSPLAVKDNDPKSPLDEARFTAGVVKLYEAVLKEPIPEEMLRLISQIGKQERQ
jgi:hypothetical protein